MLPSQSMIERPLLEALIELGGKGKPRDIYPLVTKRFPKLTDEDLKLTHKSGAVVWTNRIQFTRQGLVAKGEIDKSVKGVWAITEKGRDRVNNPPEEKTKTIHQKVVDKWANLERLKIGSLHGEVLTTKVNVNDILPRAVWLEYNNKETDGLSKIRLNDLTVYQCVLEVQSHGSREDLCVRVSIILPYVTRVDIIADNATNAKLKEYLERLCDPNIVKTRVQFHDLTSYLKE